VAFLWQTSDAPPGIFVQAADGSGSPTRLSTGVHVPLSWSADRRTIAFVEELPDNSDVWTLTLPERRVKNVTRSPFNDVHPTFSPDGKWLAVRRTNLAVMRSTSLRSRTLVQSPNLD
jgi:TolB protein